MSLHPSQSRTSRVFALAAAAMLSVVLSACGSQDSGGDATAPIASEGEIVAVNLTRSDVASDAVVVKASGDNLIDLNATWPTWAGADSGITFDAESGSLRIPGDGSDVVLGVRRFDTALTGGTSYTLNVESSDPQTAAVLFLFDANGTIVPVPGTEGLATARDGSAVTFTAPTDVAGFYLQVQNQYQATSESTISAQLIEGAGSGGTNGENLINVQGAWPDWSGNATGINGESGTVTIPAPTNGASLVYGIQRYETGLTPGTEYELAALAGSDAGASVLLFLLDASGQVISFAGSAGSTPWLNALADQPQRFTAPDGVASLVVQVQGPFAVAQPTVVVPSLMAVSGEVEPPMAGACNRLSNGDFESGSNDWQSSVTPSLTTTANNSTQALAFSNGWISYEVPVDGSALAWRFTGFYKLNDSNAVCFAGIDILDGEGSKIGDVVTRLRYFEPDSETVSDTGFIRFERNVTLPANARSLRAWIYSEAEIIVDDLDLRIPGCRTTIAGSGLLSLLVPCRGGPDLTEPAGAVELTADFENQLYYVDGVRVLTTNSLFVGFGQTDPNGSVAAADSTFMLDDHELAIETIGIGVVSSPRTPSSYSLRTAVGDETPLVLTCFIRN